MCIRAPWSLLQVPVMPRPPIRRANLCVVSVGIKTMHWTALTARFPKLLNCAMNVKTLLKKDRGESTHCTGLDDECSGRIKCKPAYPLLKLLGHILLDTFGILLVVCSSGRHRSVALAKDIALEWGALLMAPCHRSLGNLYMSPHTFADLLTSYVADHIGRLSTLPFPILSIGKCGISWSGTEWAMATGMDGVNYHSPAVGDTIIQLYSRCDPMGWMYGTVAREGSVEEKKYLPPSCYTSGHLFEGVPDSNTVLAEIRKGLNADAQCGAGRVGGGGCGGKVRRPGDWDCSICGAHVYAFREECFKCSAAKPGGGQVSCNGAKTGGASLEGRQMDDIQLELDTFVARGPLTPSPEPADVWTQHFDPKHERRYWHNAALGQSTWTNPCKNVASATRKSLPAPATATEIPRSTSAVPVERESVFEIVD